MVRSSTVPLGFVSLTENLMMVAVAVWMLVTYRSEGGWFLPRPVRRNDRDFPKPTDKNSSLRFLMNFCPVSDIVSLSGRNAMEAATSKPTALVVEDDAIQRMSLVELLETLHVSAIECDSAEAATLVLENMGGALCFMMTDVNLAGAMTGVQLAAFARQHFPQMAVIVTSARAPPVSADGILFLPKPWNSAEVVKAAHAACGQNSLVRNSSS